MNTWSYLPHTEEDRRSMLEAIGVKSVEELFADIPAEVRMKRPLNLPPALSEMELKSHIQELALQDRDFEESLYFLGAGAYDHYIPSVVKNIVGRSEFLTAYTQYQPEISQGYLQALWEYQSLICLLTGMEMAVTSLYDGSTAMAEASLMACGITGRNEILISRTVHPHWRDVLATYARDRDVTIRVVDYVDGVTSLDALSAQVNEKTAAVICQNPNFFGCVEDMKQAAQITQAKGALFIAAVNPISLGVLEAPGILGADIVVGEGQSMGLPVSFGGPYIGFLATRDKWLRRTPGRIVGQTVDSEGTRGFVLTIQAREQHIRREKATSNICSNEALCSLAVAVYLSALGREGIRQVAELCLQKAHYAQKRIIAVPGFKPVFSQPFFNEFVVRCPLPPTELNFELQEAGVVAGLDLGKYYPELNGCMLTAVTEKRTREEIELLAGMLKEVSA
ncbi:MAG TPA: aminomethyl-transferring glycine dehydrogenase subunit GcvPA [Negativicutes bacterium]|nr:aminomethyl-transferring glycine dehydrogenase subunit GcvPA [Negativicutes bacterium]